MNLKRHKRILLAVAVTTIIWWHYHTPTPTVLSFHVGEPFEEVVKNSSYPVMERSNLPADDPDPTGFGVTWVTEPAVIVRFNDPQHGFTLPPTKFAALGYMHNKASTLATNPMLDTLPFDEAFAVLENLQKQFKAGGWTPYTRDGSVWFDLTAEGKKRLYAQMLDDEKQEATLRVPNKYAMTFRFRCTEGCWTHEPPYRFIIDVGVGHDTYADQK